MVMPAFFRGIKYNIGAGVESFDLVLSKIITGIETHSVLARLQLVIRRQQVGYPPVIIGYTGGQYDPPFSGLLNI